MRADGGSSTRSVPATPRRRRSRPAIACTPACARCFYCHEAINADWKHEHDHFPIPWRHDGDDTVAACLRCHSLKDRVGWHRWARAAIESAAHGMPPRAVLMMLYLVDEGDPPSSFGEMDDAVCADIRSMVAECTSAEARIAIAKAVAQILDRDRAAAATDLEHGAAAVHAGGGR